MPKALLHGAGKRKNLRPARAIHRLRRVTITTESYEVPRGFDFRKYMADSFGIEKGGRPVEVAIWEVVLRCGSPKTRKLRRGIQYRGPNTATTLTSPAKTWSDTGSGSRGKGFRRTFSTRLV